MVKYFFIILGCLFFAIGFVGVFVPVLPTTVFMLLALWAFSRSSQRLHDYLWHHPRFGAAVRDWYQYGIVPRRAKVAAVLMMSGSAGFLLFFSAAPAWGVGAAIVIMAGVAIWLLGRPECKPDEHS